jgi:hypothetical protein
MQHAVMNFFVSHTLLLATFMHSQTQQVLSSTRRHHKPSPVAAPSSSSCLAASSSIAGQHSPIFFLRLTRSACVAFAACCTTTLLHLPGHLLQAHAARLVSNCARDAPALATKECIQPLLISRDIPRVQHRQGLAAFPAAAFGVSTHSARLAMWRHTCRTRTRLTECPLRALAFVMPRALRVCILWLHLPAQIAKRMPHLAALAKSPA